MVFGCFWDGMCKHSKQYWGHRILRHVFRVRRIFWLRLATLSSCHQDCEIGAHVSWPLLYVSFKASLDRWVVELFLICCVCGECRPGCVWFCTDLGEFGNLEWCLTDWRPVMSRVCVKPEVSTLCCIVQFHFVDELCLLLIVDDRVLKNHLSWAETFKETPNKNRCFSTCSDFIGFSPTCFFVFSMFIHQTLPFQLVNARSSHLTCWYTGVHSVKPTWNNGNKKWSWLRFNITSTLAPLHLLIKCLEVGMIFQYRSPAKLIFSVLLLKLISSILIVLEPGFPRRWIDISSSCGAIPK